ncbi:MAG: hypothetical protein ACQEQV_05905, partial [Fibrobacterota bacterium]
TARADLESRTISGRYWEGDVRLDRDHKKVTVHETYLEIEEEVELAAVGRWGSEPPADQQNALEITGTFTLPSRSVITGAVLWDKGNALRAKLKPTNEAQEQYNDEVDHDWTWDPSPEDPLLIGLDERGKDNDTYQIALFPLAWKGTKRLRIHYILPVSQKEGSFATMIPRVFATACGGNTLRPDFYTADFTGADSITEITLTRKEKSLTRRLPFSMEQSYDGKGAYSITRPDFASGGTMLSTTMPGDSVLTGEFMHYWSTIPDTLLTAAGIKREVVFLWRWENENSLVRWHKQNNDNYQKRLTGHGWDAMKQARKIYNVSTHLLNSHAGISLVHDRSTDTKDTLFEMSHGRSESADMLNYVRLFTQEENLMAVINGYTVTNEDDGDSLSAAQLDSICKEGAEDFNLAIDTVLAQFSADENILKHVVVLTAGKRKSDGNIEYVTNLDGFEDITISGLGNDGDYPQGYWPGVDMRTLISDHQLMQAQICEGISIPRQKDVQFTAALKSSKGNLYMDVPAKEQDSARHFGTIYFTGHAKEAWSDSVYWNAQSPQGEILAEYTQVPHRRSTTLDTAVVMLWGGSSSSPYSESIKNGSIGRLMGFIDEEYALLALPEDSMSDEVQKALEEGGDIDYLSEDEIFEPTEILRTERDKTALTDIRSTLQGVRFRYRLPGAKKAELSIYNVQGKLVARFSGEELLQQETLFWNGLGRDGSRIPRGMYLAVLTTDIGISSQRFIR